MLPVLAWSLMTLPLFISVQSSSSDCGNAVITVQPTGRSFYFYRGQKFELPCAGSGKTKPKYTWKKDGKDFSPAGNDPRVVQLSGEGTLVFNPAHSKDAGIYQCFVSTDFGTSMTLPVWLIEIEVDDYTKREPQTHTVKLGEPLVLPCDPPKNIPENQPQWFFKERDDDIRPVGITNRVMVDGDYNLRFAHVVRGDERDSPYVCSTFNIMSLERVIGPSHYIKIAGAPDIQWRKRSDKPTKTTTNIERGFGLNNEMRIVDLRPEDEGQYECCVTGSESLSHTFDVEIQARAAIISQDKFQYRQTGKGGMVSFSCDVEGIPKPQVEWFINGSKLTDAVMNKADITVSNNGNLYHLSVEKVEFSMTVQCNAYNLHYSEMATSFLCVSDDFPVITRQSGRTLHSVAGNEVHLTCHFLHSQDGLLQVRWLKEGVTVMGDRFQILPAGSLHIKDVRSGDSGLYQCQASHDTHTTKGHEVNLVVCEESPCPSAANTIVSLSQLTLLLCFITLMPLEWSSS